MLNWVMRHKYLCMIACVGGLLGWVGATADERNTWYSIAHKQNDLIVEIGERMTESME